MAARLQIFSGAIRDIRSLRRRDHAGFSYVALLILLAVIAGVAASTIQLGSIAHRRDAEIALIEAGGEISIALARYSQSTPAGAPRFPKQLADLVQDPRQLATVRHIRRIPFDPITGRADWELLLTPDGFVIGVRSRSTKPVIRARLETKRESDGYKEVAETYRDWVFSPFGVTGSEVRDSLPRSAEFVRPQQGVGLARSSFRPD
jgi:type II secretory pathway pseudopilin PulG